MTDTRLKVLIVHNVPAPYRLPLFERLSEEFNLEVFFCGGKSRGRKWKIHLEEYTFDNKILRKIRLGPFVINYTLPIRLLTNSYDAYIVGENLSNIFATFTTLAFSKLFNKKFILWSGAIGLKYEDVFPWYKSFLIKAYNWFIENYRKFLYRFCDSFIAYSSLSKKFLVERGAPEERISIGGQVMPRELLPNSSVKKSDTKYRDKKVILTLSYLHKRKGIDHLIEAYKQLNVDDTVLIIAGSDSEEKRLKEIAGDREDIVFVGYIDGEEKARYYSIADVFVLPTLHDPWGLVVNEAMHYGLPVITTSASGVSEIIAKERSGVVVEPGNINSLSEALKKLLNYEPVRDEMSINSKNTDVCSVDRGIKPFIEAIDYIRADHD